MSYLWHMPQTDVLTWRACVRYCTMWWIQNHRVASHAIFFFWAAASVDRRFHTSSYLFKIIRTNLTHIMFKTLQARVYTNYKVAGQQVISFWKWTVMVFFFTENNPIRCSFSLLVLNKIQPQQQKLCSYSFVWVPSKERARKILATRPPNSCV